MFVALRLLTLPQARLSQRDAIVAQLNRAAAELDNVVSAWAAPVLETAVINAGHIVWRMTFTSESQAIAVELNPAWARLVARLLAELDVTAIGYRITRSAVRPAGAGIWRALIFRVMPSGFPAPAAELESALMMMPKHVAAIRSWALSPIATIDGPKAYTHVWEQEFDDLSGLTGEYMAHPIHWGVVDSWFDAESPDYVVDPQLIQVIGRIDRMIIGAAGPATPEASKGKNVA